MGKGINDWFLQLSVYVVNEQLGGAQQLQRCCLDFIKSTNSKILGGKS